MGIAIPSYNDEKSAAASVSDTVVELSLCCCKTGCIYSKKMYRLKKTPLCTEMFLCTNCPKWKRRQRKNWLKFRFIWKQWLIYIYYLWKHWGEYIETFYWNFISIKLILKFTDRKKFLVSKYFKAVYHQNRL